ncbi:energy-coupling factor transporter ATP-binding protein EcfA2 [Pseudarthrobacter defluvii]|uniref:ABC transporter ATP-binding protein n=1 Tax=Pseudarthrobacter defluvii TaxID=410837 RepID=UPI00277F2965|nr:ABC transporter ATP-binding protein [Pseudarthrobacter defluvii]MDQ0770613.1 energy-coupling factor transporter ATP-binding protein EcfA2 [Pseudarthrobacter defluvii]
MLSARQLHAKGRRDPLLPPTSLTLRRGELLLVTGERQDQRTALSLLLSGRMKATGGDISWDSSPRSKQLRLVSALVDSPGVNEPEEHLSVRDLVTEDLALIPRRYRGALLSGPWLKVNRFEDIADLWTEQLEPRRRLELLTALALANPRTDLLVVDSPDRHSADGLTWLPRLQELAYDAGRPLAVVAAVSAVPASWDGPVAAVGNDELQPTRPAPGGTGPAEDDHAVDATVPAGKHAASAGQDPENSETTLETEVAK